MEVNVSKTDYFYCAQHIDNYTLVWVNIEYLVPLTINCLVERLALAFDRKTNTTSNRPGVKIKVPGWGQTEETEYLGNIHLSRMTYYGAIVDALVTHEGLVRGKTIRSAPYDFRKGFAELDGFLEKLRRLIEETFVLAGNRPVILIGHSYGCLQLLRLLQMASPAWKQKFVRSFVSLDGPFYGSVVSLRMFISGYNLNIPTLRPRWLREAQRTWPSSYLLMPDPRQWPPHDLLVAAPNKNYTMGNLKELFYDLGYPDGWTLYQMTRLRLKPEIPPGVETFCIYGQSTDLTDGWLDYREDPGWPYEAVNPKVVYGAGDGTVPLRSLDGCSLWIRRQSQKVHVVPINGAKHFTILQDPRLLDYLRSVVLDQGTPV